MPLLKNGLRLLGTLVLTSGLCLFATGLLARAVEEGATASTLVSTGVAAVILGALLLLVPRHAPDGRRLFAVAAGLWPFAAFGAFLWWQIGLSTEQREACIQDEDAVACETLAHRRHRRGQLDDARELHLRACNLAPGRSCFSLAGLLLQGRYGAPEPAEARNLLERACEAQHPESCATLGSLLRTGQGGPVDEERAASVLDLACDLGVANACAEREILPP